jgi:hypothetical protein
MFHDVHKQVVSPGRKVVRADERPPCPEARVAIGAKTGKPSDALLILSSTAANDGTGFWPATEPGTQHVRVADQH